MMEEVTFQLFSFFFYMQDDNKSKKGLAEIYEVCNSLFVYIIGFAVPLFLSFSLLEWSYYLFIYFFSGGGGGCVLLGFG